MEYNQNVGIYSHTNTFRHNSPSLLKEEDLKEKTVR